MTLEPLREPYARLKVLLSPSQTKSLVMLSLFIGLSTGLMTFFFNTLIIWIRSLAAGGPYLDWAVRPFPDRLWLIVVPALGGLLIAPLIVWLAPEAKGDGVPQTIQAVHKQDGRIRGRVAWIKALASALTLGTGGSAGREGPIVQMGAALGSFFGRTQKLPPSFMKTMAAAGAGAGISAAFNAPLAGVFFAMEVILAQFTAQAFSMVVLASVVAAFVSRALLGDHSYFYVPTYTLHRGFELILYGALGLAAAFAAQGFIWFLLRFEDAFERLKISPWLKPALGGLLVGLAGCLVPHAMGTSHEIVSLALSNQLATGLLGILLIAKIAMTSWTLGSGGSGGVFMPSLVVGAMLGGWFGGLMGGLFPGTASPGAYAMVGMGACFAAMTHAPMTSILILFEMTYDYDIILPVMTATVIAVLASRALRQDSVYMLALSRKGIVLRPRLAPEALSQIPVEQAMTKRVRTIRDNMTLEHLTQLIEQSPHTGFPVLDEYQDVVGLVTFSELHQALEQRTEEAGKLIVAAEIMRRKPPTVFPNSPIQQAMNLMEEQHVDRLPVVDRDDPRKLVGIITKGDIANVFHKLMNGT
ncbi:MAG TPA: chloride channel protein [bacterium]